MATTELHLDYIEKFLIREIVDKLENEELDSYKAEKFIGLDSFMSALYNIQLKTITKPSVAKERLLIAKFMKGDDTFRTTSRAYTQFENEVFLYAKVLPAFKSLLDAAAIAEISITNWIAPAYMAKFGYIEGLSVTPTAKESILVLEHLKPDGYTLGPHICLRRDQLYRATEPLAEFHALSYALRHQRPAEFENLRSGIKLMPFVTDDGSVNLKRITFRIAFDRFFGFVDRQQHALFHDRNGKDKRLLEALHRLRQKYFEQPTRLLERLRTSIVERSEDEQFAAILHGDYNRNNILFRDRNAHGDGDGHGDGDDSVVDAKMIDFQELRYGSPALDLSVVMYMNMSADLRSEIWLDLLKAYHGRMCRTLSLVLPPEAWSNSAVQYSFENFNEHFKRFAFYGVMFCVQFMPWVLGTEAERARISKLFECDLHGEEFRQIALEIGGDAITMRTFEIVRHACEMGYMDHI